MTIAVGSSVALKWVLGEPDSDVAIALRVEDLRPPRLCRNSPAG